jgi:hypothetical protein
MQWFSGIDAEPYMIPILRTLKKPKMKSHLSSVFGACILILSANSVADPLGQLTADLSGNFSSAAQASEDKDFYNIELHIVPVWLSRKDGPWLYVEQADARTPEKPYRQRLYRLESIGDHFYSYVYEFKTVPLKYAGQWREGLPLANISPDDLILKSGCTVKLAQDQDGHFAGGTEERSCPSILRGASYATSKIELNDHRLTTWDQGFDADGKQVWGATKGPYRFDKQLSTN